MKQRSLEFGFYPDPLEINVGDMNIRTLPHHEEAVSELRDVPNIDNGWFFAPRQQTRNFMSGQTYEKPYSKRVFELPKTHIITHRSTDSDDHLAFHIWSLSFFLGIRLTGTEAGFLDATPLRPHTLTDFVLHGDGLAASVALAERFWTDNRSALHRSKRFAAAVHALFLAQYPLALEYERFIYLYTALDACYALVADMNPPKKPIPHGDRAAWLCRSFGMAVPAWAVSSGKKGAQVAALRNDALHEALYMGEPFGFAVHGVGIDQNLTLELKALISRFLVALVGASSAAYVQAPTNTRQRYPLRIT